MKYLHDNQKNTQHIEPEGSKLKNFDSIIYKFHP